jgi:SNF2 family DNA or RNA helicase
MVREREPPTPGRPQAPNNNDVEATVAATPPKSRALYDLTNEPQFGKTSPIRNTLHKVVKKAENSIFNIPKMGQPRPEHHKSQQPGQTRNVSGSSASGTQHGGAPTLNPYANSVAPSHQAFRMPPPFPSATSIQPKPNFKPVPDVYEVPRPTGYQPQTTYAAPPPMFSSNTHGFVPVNRPLYPPTRPIDLTQNTEDEFDPDAAIRNDRFGAPDAYRYVDPSRANEDLKALLEGAFDDEDDKPRLRKRKPAPKKETPVAVAKNMVDKLKAIGAKEDTKEEVKGTTDMEEDEDEEDGTVEGLACKLLPHQVEGVAWMNDREMSTKKKNGVLPRGGILADDMGLGKTIQAVALMLQNPRPSLEEAEKDKKNKIPPSCSKCTLVVAPLALIKQWEAEIKDKVDSSHRMKVLVHHGPSRTKRAADLQKYDVVITTYQILASEHANSSDADDGIKFGCYGVHWYRVILDEAHSIKNRNAKSTKACYALRSHYRWCLTGTPMQNNLDELQSLICYLKIKPYCDMGPWKEQITQPMKNGRGALAMRRLQYFLKSCMKRRTKDILKKDGALNPGGKVKEGETAKFRIVDREVETVVAHFDEHERKFYDRLSDRAQSRLDEMMGGEKTDYIGALVLLLRLRQACNHPQLIGSNVKNDKDALTTGSSQPASGVQSPRKQKAEEEDIDDIANLMGGLTVETKKCDVCQFVLSKEEADSGSNRCSECDGNLSAIKQITNKTKHRKNKKGKKHRSEDSSKPKPSRRRPVVDDSDEEEEGDWVVPKTEQRVSHLGTAGDTDDENAEGGGEDIGSDDSATDSESEEISRAKKLKKKVINVDTSDEEADSAEDSEDDSEESDSSTDSEIDSSLRPKAKGPKPPMGASTKIRYLIDILAKETPKHKVIVFSQFTSMLDLVEPFLKSAGHNFTRYDGSMKNDLREESLNKLRNDKKCRVLLCSLKCGSLGLNLTAASRVVILEPFWNPVSSIILAAKLDQHRD